MYKTESFKEYAKQVREAKTTEEAEAIMLAIVNGIYEKGYNAGYENIYEE